MPQVCNADGLITFDVLPAMREAANWVLQIPICIPCIPLRAPGHLWKRFELGVNRLDF